MKTKAFSSLPGMRLGPAGRREEHRLLSLIAQETVNTIILTNLDGRITWVNEAFTRSTGYSFEEAIGKNPGALLDCPEKDRTALRILNTKVRTRQPFRLEIQNQGKDGRRFWWEVYYQPLYDEAGQITQFFSLNTDITERKQLQQELDEERDRFRKRLTAAAVRASEAERSAVGAELHDNVNQVLTTVKLYLELMSSGTVPPQELMDKSARLVQESINEIRSLSKRLSAPTLGDILLRDSLIELVDSVAAAGQVSFTLDTEGYGTRKTARDLHLAVYRIVQEGLTNILKHSGATEVTIRLSLQRGELRLEIGDNGRGFRTRSKRKGIGVTNMMSRMEIFNGSLRVQSAPGAGCRLHARVPVMVVEGVVTPKCQV